MSTPREFDLRNAHFDRLFNTPGLMWLDQNTNHFEAPAEVTAAMLDSIRREAYHAYARPASIETLRELIRQDLGLPNQSVLVTDAGVAALYTVCRTLCEPDVTLVTTDPGWKWPLHFSHAAGADV
jgi:histidinol-phosphate/aromatic aminotransferase/cobyric acid decarboxylase-like protein